MVRTSKMAAKKNNSFRRVAAAFLFALGTSQGFFITADYTTPAGREPLQMDY